MKERPILFNAAMVRAILEGKKTQTRRVIKPLGNDGGFVLLDHGNGFWPYRSDDGDSSFHSVKRGDTVYLDETPHACPYGKPGDQLWVRETWRTDAGLNDQAPSSFSAWPIQYDADGHVLKHGSFFGNTDGKTRVSIHMPRWASRISLEIAGVRVERLNDISEADAIAEGVEAIPYTGESAGPNRYSINMGGYWLNSPTAAGAYRMLWESINGDGSWDANPWVWAVELKRLPA